MAHGIGLPDFYEKVFLFKQLAFASKSYCRNEGLCRTPTERNWSEEPWRDYSYALRTMVSSYMLEFAIKTRVLADSMKSQLLDQAGVRELEVLQNELSSGVVHLGDFDLTMHQVCNKIVHATRVDLGWADRCVKTAHRYTHWTGIIHLHGSHFGELWHVELNASCLAFDMDLYMQGLVGLASDQGLKSILPD